MHTQRPRLPIEVIDGKIVIRNIYEVPKLPSYYVNDPDENLRNLGNTTSEDFVSIQNWCLGTPHKYASPNEVDHDFDWSEFEGFHAHEDISSIRDAYVRGVGWCNDNLQCAKVFGALYTQQPIIYPDHPEHAEFMNQFRESYWDLIRIVPGLGDFGRVLAHPFGSVPNEEEGYREAYSKRGDLSAIYGMNNPPHPNKVFYEILKFGAMAIDSNLKMYKQMCPELEFDIKTRMYSQDIYLMASLLPQVQEKCNISKEISEYLELELFKNYDIQWNPNNRFITGERTPEEEEDDETWGEWDMIDDDEDDEDEPDYMTGYSPYDVYVAQTQ